MAKRWRLTPPTGSSEDTNPAGTETKSIFPAVRPPIAQVAGEASAMAAFEGIAAEMLKARNEGRMIEAIPLPRIAADHLVRDRMTLDGDEMEALTASIRARGQQVPIEVLDRGEGAEPRYGLISGWRRLAALRAIGAETALAIIRRPATAAEAYVAMVEENEIRSDISFYERARIVSRALEEGIYPDPKTALQDLFGNVSRAKRSKIKSFMTVVSALDGALRFPTALSERAGLDLVRRLEEDPELAGLLVARLGAAAPQTAEAELALLAAAPPKPPAAPKAPERFTAELDPARQEIRIAGAGVDADLLRDLQRWLARR